MKNGVMASAVLGLWSLLAPAAWSQGGYVPPPTSPFPQQPLSPYLNLLRPGNSAINYYGLVRPQQQFYSSLQQLQQQVQAPVNTVIVADPNAFPITGHPTRFLNYSHYFFNQGGAGVVSGGTTGFPGYSGTGAPILGTGPLPPLRSGGTPSQSRPGTSPLRTGF
jgi:hypothetical protein